jgi:hypothetical protein
MPDTSDDLVLETLLAIRKEVAPDLDEKLVRSCYAIQKKHQFDRDHALPTQAMDRLIEQRVDAVVPSAGDKGNS